MVRLPNGGCFDEWAGEPVRCPEALDLTRPLMLEDGTLLANVTPEPDFGGFSADAPDAETDKEGRAFKADGTSYFGTGDAVYAVQQSVSSTNSLPEDDAARLDYPMFDGLMAYFPNALAEVSRVSKVGNDQHNPGQPMHWARDKSTDHENKIMRHLVDVGRKDARGVRHAARLAWRALALLQEELEREEGAPRSRASR